MSERERSDTGRELRAALDAMGTAYEQASAAIEATPDPQQAFEQAGVLREAADQLVGHAADLRALMADRVRDAENLSLAALAERLGVSKARADQLHRVAEAVKSGREVGVLTGWFLPSDADAPTRRVAICGSRAVGANVEVIDETVRTLGALLTRSRYRVTHGPVGVGIEVLTHIADHYRPPGLGTVTGIFGRPNIMRSAEYVLVIGGGQGTQVEVDLSISMGKKLLPMPVSGGTAAHAYALLQKDAALRQWMPEKTFAALATADADGFARIVKAALSDTPNDAGSHHD